MSMTSLLEWLAIAPSITADLLGPAAVLYLPAGLAAAWRVGARTRGGIRQMGVSFVLALFFSVSFAVGRLAVPVPTLIAVVAGGCDALVRAAAPADWFCVPSLDGCAPLDEGELVIAVPFALQWAVCLALVALVRALAHWRRK